MRRFLKYFLPIIILLGLVGFSIYLYGIGAAIYMVAFLIIGGLCVVKIVGESFRDKIDDFVTKVKEKKINLGDFLDFNFSSLNENTTKH
jgi:hypothetical protein